jgi:hypothetical protein
MVSAAVSATAWATAAAAAVFFAGTAAAAAAVAAAVVRAAYGDAATGLENWHHRATWWV